MVIIIMEIQYQKYVMNLFQAKCNWCLKEKKLLYIFDETSILWCVKYSFAKTEIGAKTNHRLPMEAEGKTNHSKIESWNWN